MIFQLRNLVEFPRDFFLLVVYSNFFKGMCIRCSQLLFHICGYFNLQIQILYKRNKHIYWLWIFSSETLWNFRQFLFFVCVWYTATFLKVCVSDALNYSLMFASILYLQILILYKRKNIVIGYGFLAQKLCGTFEIFFCCGWYTATI